MQGKRSGSGGKSVDRSEVSRLWRADRTQGTPIGNWTGAHMTVLQSGKVAC